MNLTIQVKDWAAALTLSIGLAAIVVQPVPTPLPPITPRAPALRTERIDPLNTVPDGVFDPRMLRYATPLGLVSAENETEPEVADPATPQEAEHTSLAAALREVSGLSPDTLAVLANVSRVTYFKWLQGGGIRRNHALRLSELHETFSTLRELRGVGLQRFLETVGPAGRPLDLLAKGDASAVLGLAMRAPTATPARPLISEQARQASGVPGRFRPVARPAWSRSSLQGPALDEALDSFLPRALPEHNAPIQNDDDEVILVACSVITG